MNDHIEWHFPRRPLPRSVGRARTLLVGQARAWKVPDDAAETTTLLLSELMTNALRHAGCAPGREIWVRLAVQQQTVAILRIEVFDACVVLPHPRDASPDDKTGRCLALVDTLASQ
ncbi:ATP-binding protein [Streptomyces sp. ISL-100]|uniref:ATP-binding protein n=1 Tax=Streptomyces sp. ISL-100 TaxID=2819173 RepID=UPI001BEB1392|nr:ATP-binding protein [Streptomyces sp. ISL-100]MBT2396083.1 ATP-binding protein [Streptomyces sp. ISL-100]